MTVVLVASLFGMAALTAVRSTWSPCGRSMLSTITPLGERSRGARYGASAAWFVAGALCGGTCLGGVLAGLAATVAVARPAPGVVAGLVGALAVATAASDTRIGGFRLPFHRRQVNELWLDRFRPWVYGAGFGWQIGVGFVTYVTCAGLYLLVVVAALGAHPLLAFAGGLSFGALRGLAVLLGRGLTGPEALRRFHRRFDAAEPLAAAAVVAGELVTAAGALGFHPVAGAVGVSAAALCVLASRTAAGYTSPSARQAPRTTADVV